MPAVRRNTEKSLPLPVLVPIGQDPEPTLDPQAVVKFVARHGAIKEPVVAVIATGVVATEEIEVVLADTAIEVEDGKAKVIKGSIIKKKYKDQYKRNGFSCGDHMADELKAYVTIFERGKAPFMDDGRLKEVAMANGVWKETYAALNKGQRRMTIGNCLRTKYKNGDKIDIGGCIMFDEALQEEKE